MGRGKGLGAGAGSLRTLPSAQSFSLQHWAPALFVSLGPGVLLGSGVAPALLEAPPPPPPPGRCRRACQQGRDESWSSDWPLRHRRPLLPAKGQVFSLVLDCLCGFYKLSSFILFQALVFQQGENLQEGNFPLGSCYLAQLGLGEGGNGPLCSVLDVGVGPWEGRLLHHGPSARHGEAQSAHPGGRGESWWSALLRVSAVTGRAGSWTPLTCPCLSLSPRALLTPVLDRHWGHKLPGPALSSLALVPLSLRGEEWPKAFLAPFLFWL